MKKTEIVKKLLVKEDLSKLLENYEDDEDYGWNDVIDRDDMETMDIADYDEEPDYESADDEDYVDWDDHYGEEDEEEDDEEVSLEDLSDAASEEIDWDNIDKSEWSFIIPDNATTKEVSDKILEDLINTNSHFKKYFTPSRVQDFFNLKLSVPENRKFEIYMNSLEGDENKLHLSRDSQLKVYYDAQTGDFNARVYLYTRYLRITAHAYWTYFVRFLQKGLPTKPAGYFIDDASASAVAAIGFQVLSNDNSNSSGKDYKSPYDAFDISKYSEDTDILTVFSWWYFRYLQSRIISLIGKMERGGVVGNLPKNVYHNALIAFLDDLQKNSHWEPSVESHEDQVVDDIMNNEVAKPLLAKITKYLDSFSHPKYKVIFNDHVYNGMDFPSIAKKMGVSNQYVNMAWNYFLKSLMTQHPNWYEEFKTLKLGK